MFYAIFNPFWSGFSTNICELIQGCSSLDLSLGLDTSQNSVSKVSVSILGSHDLVLGLDLEHPSVLGLGLGLEMPKS